MIGPEFKANSEHDRTRTGAALVTIEGRIGGMIALLLRTAVTRCYSELMKHQEPRP